MLTAANKATPSSQRQLTHLQRACFSYNHNFHHPTHFYVNGIRHTTDYNTDLYAPHIRAFLTKRWTARREIPPKISIMRDMGPSFRQIYYQQRLPFSEYMYDEKHL